MLKFSTSKSAKLAMAAAALLAAPMPAAAYIGPGVGAGAIAVVLGVIGSVLLAIFAVLYYPIKRALKNRRRANTDDAEPSTPET